MAAVVVVLVSVTFFLLSKRGSVHGSLLDPTLIGRELQTFAREGLGVEEMQRYFDGLHYHKNTIDAAVLTPELANKIANKFKERFAVVQRLKAAVEASYARSVTVLSRKECCKVNGSSLKYDFRFRSEVNLNDACIHISGSASPNPRQLDNKVVEEMKDIFNKYPFIKWQYFGSEEGLMTNFPVFEDKEDCTDYDPRYRPYYVETATPEPKDVVLVIDTSRSMAGRDLDMAVEAANLVLDTMNPKDQVGVVSFNTEASTPGGVGARSLCYSEQLALATPVNINSLKMYVSGLVPHGKSQYSLAFEKAFRLLKASFSGDSNKRKAIIFLTDGSPTEPEGNKKIFETIRDMNNELNNSVVIMTFGIGNVDHQILQDIAKQDGTNYGVPPNTSVEDIAPGKYIFVEDIKTLRNEMATYYSLFASGRQLNRPVVSVPYIDAFGLGLVTSISLPCYDRGKFIGVAATDFSMENLLVDIKTFNQGQSTYAFMISGSGRTLIHPLLPAPSDAYGDPIFMDIRTLEPEQEFNDVFDSMTMGKSGTKTFVAKRYLARGGKEMEGVTVKRFKSSYHWAPVQDTNFSVCVVVPISYTDDLLDSLEIPDGFKFRYHRIDLAPPQKPCLHFGEYAVKDTTVVKFAPGAFLDPYSYLGQDETRANVDLLKAYMTDTTGTVRNPGLRNDIRDTVIATWKVEDLWLRSKTEFAQYFVWRYIGTANGVFMVTPGSVVPKKYDPRKRSWYYTALSHTGLLVLTTPYLVLSGAGVVITAARALDRGETSHQHHANDEILGVMGADFPLTYFYRLLTKVYPKCKETKTYSCFVMDSAGFLIMHEDFLLSSATAKDVEYVHITEKEKNIAEDLIKKKYLTRKQCRNLEKIQKQSFYEVNLPLGGVNVLGSGESCTKYQLGKIGGTNAYLGVAVRETSCVAESCSCFSDNTCSYSPLTCECPCTSPLEFHFCRSQFPNSSLPICPVPAPQIKQSDHLLTQMPGLEKCFDPRCQEKNSSETCDGIVSCYWCVNNKHDVPLDKPYCAGAEVCFRGKEVDEPDGSESEKPTKENHDRDPSFEDTEDKNSISHGAIAGITIGCVAAATLIVIASLLVLSHCRYIKRHPDVEHSSTSQMAIPASATRPPVPTPSPVDNPSPEQGYENPEPSVHWPWEYDDVRGVNGPPAENLDSDGYLVFV